MDDWQRAIAFMRALDERAAEQTVPFRWGRAFVNRRFALVHDANYLLADRVEGATAPALMEEAERLQGGLQLSHRRVNVDDQGAAVQLSEGFQTGGYVAERFTIMVWRRSPDRTDQPGIATEVGWDKLRESRRRQRLAEPWATPQLVQQILDRQAFTATLVPTRYYGVMADGQVVSSCEVRRSGRVAQIETVETLAPHRNRGLGSAVVGAAIGAAREAEFVFLVADYDDWPQHWYRRFGFEPVGIESRFLRLLHA